MKKVKKTWHSRFAYARRAIFLLSRAARLYETVYKMIRRLMFLEFDETSNQFLEEVWLPADDMRVVPGRSFLSLRLSD